MPGIEEFRRLVGLPESKGQRPAERYFEPMEEVRTEMRKLMASLDKCYALVDDVSTKARAAMKSDPADNAAPPTFEYSSEVRRMLASVREDLKQKAWWWERKGVYWST